MPENDEEKLYLDFFNSLVEDVTDKKIIKLVIEELEEEEIVEKLLGVKE